MRRFLACSGVLGRPKSLEWLRRAVEVRRPDGVLFAGGVLSGVRQHAAPATPWGLAREEALFIERFFEALGELGVFCAVIPGPGDTPLIDFLRMGMRAELESPGVHIVHATLVAEGDVAVCGMGGPVGGSNGADDGNSRTLVEYHLRPLWAARQPQRVLLLASPPTGPLGGEAGSSLIADLIDSYHPSLCVVGGLNGRRGSRRMASTLVVNPGHLAEGWAVWLDRGRPGADAVEFVNLHAPEAAGIVADLGVCD
jgi:Icc-related predicted phosphoesterase